MNTFFEIKFICRLPLVFPLILLLAGPVSAEEKEVVQRHNDGQEAYDRGDYAKALGFLQPLAENGYAESQYTLARMYWHGRAVVRSASQGARWFRLAAQQGHADAKNAIGIAYSEGLGVPQDLVLAYMWFSLAAADGVTNAAQRRDQLSTNMTTKQVAEAKNLTLKWQPN